MCIFIFVIPLGTYTEQRRLSFVVALLTLPIWPIRSKVYETVARPSVRLSVDLSVCLSFRLSYRSTTGADVQQQRSFFFLFY